MARILVVEDDQTTSTLLSSKLKKNNHKVLVAATGAEALQIVEEKGRPDVAVLDIGLPDLDGKDLMGRLRQKSGLEQLPVIFLTARVGEQEVAAGRALGARYLTKPVIMSALLSAIDQSVQTEEDGW